METLFSPSDTVQTSFGQQHHTRRFRHTTATKYRHLVITIGFLLLLTLPVLEQYMGLLGEFKSTEKRNLAPFPTFHFPHVQTFISQFGQYYKENFGGRNALFYQYSRWKYNVLGISPLPQKVIVGKQHWYYPGNSLNNVADQHLGLHPLPLSTLNTIASRLTSIQQQLAKQGTRLYVLVAPDSYTIYPEYLPDHMRRFRSYSPLAVLKQHLAAHTAIPFIDVRTSLQAAKATHVVYCQTDTHWNDYGALIATTALVNYIRHDFPNIPKGQLANYVVRPQKGASGDLVTMLDLSDQLSDSINYHIEPANFLKSIEREHLVQAEGLPSQRFTGSAANRPKLLVWGDSFSYAMNQFLPGYFRETYSVRSRKFDHALPIHEHPDILIIEIVERNINLLANL